MATATLSSPPDPRWHTRPLVPNSKGSSPHSPLVVFGDLSIATWKLSDSDPSSPGRARTASGALAALPANSVRLRPHAASQSCGRGTPILQRQRFVVEWSVRWVNSTRRGAAVPSLHIGSARQACEKFVSALQRGGTRLTGAGHALHNHVDLPLLASIDSRGSRRVGEPGGLPLIAAAGEPACGGIGFADDAASLC